MTNPQSAFDQLAAFFAQQQQQQAAPAPAPAPAAQYPVHQPGYPVAPQMPQGFAPQQPAPAPVNASIDDFFNQPSAGWGPAWSFKDKPVGTTLVGVVARQVTNGDISQQTQPGTGIPLFYKDGRPKLVMKVAMNVQPDATYPEGKAQWYVQGQARDELARAMAEAGAPAGPPEVGARISVTLSGQVPNNFGTKTNQFTIKYERPQGAAPAPMPSNPAAHQYVEDGANGVKPAPAPEAPAAPQAPAAQPAPPAPAAQVPGLDPDKAALLAQLTGQQPPQS